MCELIVLRRSRELILNHFPVALLSIWIARRGASG